LNIRLFIEKKKQVSVEVNALKHQFKEFLHIKNMEDLRIFTLYNVVFPYKIDIDIAKQYLVSSLTERMAEDYYFDFLPGQVKDSTIFSVALLPGQYDQKADSASSCISLVSKIENIDVKTAKIYCVFGNLNKEEKEKIEKYLVNPVDSYLIDLDKFYLEKSESLEKEKIKENSIDYSVFKVENESDYLKIKEKLNLAMSLEDLKLIYREFEKEKRLPNYVELKVLDTYWSDHCRHTTFNTKLEFIKLDEKDKDLKDKENIKEKIDPRINTFNEFIRLKNNQKLNKNEEKFSLMELATFYAKYLKKAGKLDDVEDSEENNACSIIVEDKNNKQWLIEFKNETHNHPTEIEPFGGASTCIGGCIRDPLSARAYVFGAMRVSGSADPNQPIEKTLKGKLPQRKITTTAAKGFSSYGNQIGLATGQVVEIYHERYVAKRLEAGAVIGAALKENVIRKRPKAGNIVILVGGRTGRDGIGGATGSSKDHDESSINIASSEVQKGNPVIERKLQRFLSNPKVSKLILKCNDFGAGGVAVAVGELAKGLKIYLDKIPLKYTDLKPDEIILSESQERMACVIDKKDLSKFLEYAKEEDLEASYIADVVEDEYVSFYYKDSIVAKISRNLLDSQGALRFANVLFDKFSCEKVRNYFESFNDLALKELLKNLNVALQIGLGQIFDGTIGGFTVLAPFGGKYQLSPTEGMAFALPDIYNDETGKVVLMAMGFDPYLLELNPYIGAYYSIIESVTKIVALGGDFSKVRLSLQEYFGKTNSSEKWGIVTSALLGALQAEMDLGIPAIGGKDSMSGTFKNIDVPPTLISFAVSVEDEEKIIPSNFMKINSNLFLLYTPMKENMLLDEGILKENFRFFKFLVDNKNIISSRTIRSYSFKEALAKSSFGNKIGFSLNFNYNNDFNNDKEKINVKKIHVLKNARFGSIIFETYLTEEELFEQYLKFKTEVLLSDDLLKKESSNIINKKENEIGKITEKRKIEIEIEKEKEKDNFNCRLIYLGKTIEDKEIHIIEKDIEKNIVKESFENEISEKYRIENGESEKFILKKYLIDDLIETANLPLKDIFPIKDDISPSYNIEQVQKIINKLEYKRKEFDISIIKYSGINFNLKNKPKALILVFSGTNCEYDTSRAFSKAGFETEIFIIKTLNRDLLNQSIEECSKKILESQVLSLPGGFSMGDEPDGSGKFIASFLRTEQIKESIEKHLEKKNLILGICNGFQALLKSGLLPYGKIVESKENDPTLVQNLIGNHVSRFVHCKVLPNKSAWHLITDFDKIYFIPISHGEGRFFASKEVCFNLFENNQVTSIYVTEEGEPAIEFPDNPNGSIYSIESIISPDGLILGKMGHSERVVNGRIKNIDGIASEPIFESARKYFG